MRSPFIDQLRGWALLGIVVVNAPFLLLSITGDQPGTRSSLDVMSQALVQCFATGKFYLIFSFLFGYAVSRFFKVETETGAKRFRRRLWTLALVGFLHACLFFVGDILFSYSLLGWILFALRSKPDRVLVRVAGIAASGAVGLLVILSFPTRETQLVGGAFDAIMRNGTFGQTVIARFQTWPATLIFLGILNYGFVIACMTIGMLAGRHRFLERREEFSSFYSAAGKTGLALGLPLSIVATVFWKQSWSVPLTFASAPLLSAGYVAWFSELYTRFPKIARIADASGRMSMTCYLLESIILASLGCGWGFGLNGRIGFGATFVCAFGVWISIELFANLWLKHFDQGPVESMIGRWTKRDPYSTPGV